MHSEAECKAVTRCRDCRGSHRSDLWVWIRRPNKLGQVKKEQLAVICKIEQGRLAESTRVKAVAEKAYEAIHDSMKDVCMTDRSGFGILESEE